MRFFPKRQQRKQAGRLYTGPAAWCDDYQIVPRPGYYALTEDGKTVLGDVPLVCVDDAPDDPTDGSCHYEYAGPKDNPQRRGDGRPALRASGRVVELEVHAEGKATFSA